MRPFSPDGEAAVFRSAAAPPARTLLDVLEETTRRHPHALALDDGTRSFGYDGLCAEVERLAKEFTEAGIGLGDRVGVRVPSGTTDLYVAILAVLAVGAAYVPVDADDPDERAAMVFTEAAVCAVVAAGLAVTMSGEPGGRRGRPGPDDDAWIIFTSGSTGRPKGVAVTHRSAAAFADAEARLFTTGPGDRVLAGLSVAFDASCEEMWLAWRHGACLVAAPRSLVRTGVDLGPWLVEQGITVVSTVPTLAALWPAGALDDVRLLIFGGEACPPDLAERLAVPGREVWNTYGPTEATVVATAARLDGLGPVRIGLPLDGWELAVVGPSGEPVAAGETGELVIGGVGLARYLDPAKDAEKYAPLAALGWERAYRSGDLVRAERTGLIFVGRADEQIKVGGRRVELGEVDAALLALPGVTGAAAAVRGQILVGYLVADDGFDRQTARERLAETLPASLVPRLALVETLPVRTSGKIDRDALPWPLPTVGEPMVPLTGTEKWVADQWSGILGAAPTGPDADFFAHGGTSLAAARLVAALRVRYPAVAVGDIYEHPALGDLAARLSASKAEEVVPHDRAVTPLPRRAALAQAVLMLPLLTVGAMRWLTGLVTLNNLVSFPWAPAVSWWWVLAGWLLFMTPARMGLAAGGSRLLLRGVRPGTYPRGGRVHLRLWFAEQLAERLGAAELSGAPFLAWYARALGARVGRDVDLHSPSPVTGLLDLGEQAAIEPEVDLSGHWLDGDLLHIGKIKIGRGATVGARATLLPGTGSARTPRSRRGRRSRIRSPPTNAGRARPPSARARRVRWGSGHRCGGAGP